MAGQLNPNAAPFAPVYYSYVVYVDQPLRAAPRRGSGQAMADASSSTARGSAIRSSSTTRNFQSPDDGVGDTVHSNATVMWSSAPGRGPVHAMGSTSDTTARTAYSGGYQGHGGDHDYFGYGDGDYFRTNGGALRLPAARGSAIRSSSTTRNFQSPDDGVGDTVHSNATVMWSSAPGRGPVHAMGSTSDIAARTAYSGGYQGHGGDHESAVYYQHFPKPRNDSDGYPNPITTDTSLAVIDAIGDPPMAQCTFHQSSAINAAPGELPVVSRTVDNSSSMGGDGRLLGDRQMQKTRLCKYWVESGGRCRFGPRCYFHTARPSVST